MNQPVLGVTMGDPAGVGPEIIARAGAERSVRAGSRPVVFGAASTMREALALVGSPLTLHAVERIADCRWGEGTLEVLDFGNVDMATLPRWSSSLRPRAWVRSVSTPPWGIAATALVQRLKSTSWSV